MSLHFVTSAQAEDHIYSSDEARKTEGIVGSGGFVLSTKDKLSASMIDANTLRILEGDIIFCGRHVNITNYEEVTIQNGTPGMNSIALVVLNLKTDPSEVATIIVYEGEETSGDPVMPEYIQGDLNDGDTEAEMPLYAVTKTGLSVGDPLAQFDFLVPYNEFRTSIDQQPKSYIGSKIFSNVTGTSMRLFTTSECVQNFGRALSSARGDFVGVFNADANSCNAHIDGAQKNSNGDVYATFDRSVSSASIRVNYLVVLAP